MEKPRFLYSNLTRLLLIFEFVFASVALSSTAPNSSTDQSALLAFKSDYISHDPLGILAQNWSTTPAICRWISVSCSTRHPQRVTALNLPNMGLKGTIPPHLGNLSFPSYFNLSNNYFRGVLPTKLTRLNRLKVIDFTGNSFSGEVPAWFGNLMSLQYLLQAHNEFMGFFPVSLSNLSGLESLNLRSNFLTRNIPKEIGNIHRLKELRMANNGLSGSVPESVFNLSDTVLINLANNSLSGSLPEELCHHILRVRILIFQYNELTGRVLSTLSQCGSLWTLVLSYNKFTG